MRLSATRAESSDSIAPSSAIVRAGTISLPSVPSDSAGRPMSGSSWGMPPKRLPMVSIGKWISALTAVAISSTASGPGRRRIHAIRVAVRFHAISTASDAIDVATVGKSIVCIAASKVSILPKNSPGIFSMSSPRKSLICEMKITTAMPFVNPMTTDTGMKRIMLPSLKAPMPSSITPDIIVAISRFCTPKSATIA